MSLYKRGKIWYVDIEVTGQPRVQRSARTTNKREAERYEAELRLKLEQVKEQGKTLNDALILWLQEKERGRREKSAIRVFLKSYPNKPLSAIHGHDILDATRQWSASTYNRTANIIRASLRLAYDRGWCSEIKVYRRKTNPTRLRFLSKEEWERLEKELPTHLNEIVRLSLATGLRKSNAAHLRWSEISLEQGICWVGADKAKSKKPIGVPLSKSMVSMLKSLKASSKSKEDGLVFTNGGRPLGNFSKAWNSALKRAGIENFRWHDLRHTWASWHVQNGTPLAVLKELGGWSDINMVMRYAHLSPEHLRQYADNSNVT